MKNKEEYFKNLLFGCGNDEEQKKKFIEEAYKVALDTRKFEIELYWKRATYFWAFIGAVFVAFFINNNSANEYRFIFSAVLSMMGFFFSIGWYMVARGSKMWQKNWEMHIAYLEEEIHGPLFKTFSIPRTNIFSINSEYPFSVSKVNHILGLLTSGFWLGIFLYTMKTIMPQHYKLFLIKYLNPFYLQYFNSFIVILFLFLLGSCLLFFFSKSFQFRDVNGKNDKVRKFYSDGKKKKKGGFYYMKMDQGDRVVKNSPHKPKKIIISFEDLSLKKMFRWRN